MSRNRGRQGSGRLPTAPERSAGIAPVLPLAPIQAERIAELQLIQGFATALLFLWSARTDPTIVTRFASWAAPSLPKEVRREASDTANLAEVEVLASSGSAVMLRVATRWYCSLQLPTTRQELWSGPPLLERRRRIKSDPDNSASFRSKPKS